MFLKTEDYSVVCSDASLDIITQSSDDIRQKAERTAMEEVAGYVRSRYDIDEAYQEEGDKRNPLLVQLTVSISLYYLGMWLPHFMASDSREVLYENAIARLKDIQKGAFTPDLPQYTAEDAEGEDAGQPMRFGSMKRQRYDY